ncbi:hypothetical protein J7E79_02890 [Bacillus sp. ISL-40]|uniref:hypothetical protein n=1 Tax=unclassified Bacillus (in: firmicutes) TaxID=185979 RepID=UPI001BE8BE6C|nr:MULTISPECIES: hypothetical protein [unclassified Bacillus (in: firmicutes)]MBT2696383.1 hypothetical protein [Bacillus sp. ISL-40]MBT2743232.1 hypothetical protein [Bacillus sp. ISL-77]
MDHAIDGLMVYFELSYEELVKEWKSGEYKKLIDCPSYKEANTYRDALNVHVKGCYLPAFIKSHIMPPLSKQVREQLEIENFWAEQDGR